MGSVTRSLHQYEVFGPLCLPGCLSGWSAYLNCPCTPLPGCYCPCQPLPGCHCPCCCGAVPCCCPCCCLYQPLHCPCCCLHKACSGSCCPLHYPCPGPCSWIHLPPSCPICCFLHSSCGCPWWCACSHPWSCSHPLRERHCYITLVWRGLNSRLMLINF